MWLIRKGGMKIELPTLKETGLHTQVILMYLYVCKKTNIRKIFMLIETELKWM